MPYAHRMDNAELVAIKDYPSDVGQSEYFYHCIIKGFYDPYSRNDAPLIEEYFKMVKENLDNFEGIKFVDTIPCSIRIRFIKNTTSYETWAEDYDYPVYIGSFETEAYVLFKIDNWPIDCLDNDEVDDLFARALMAETEKHSPFWVENESFWPDEVIVEVMPR